MSKPTLLFRGPIKTQSGYGSHARDLLESIYKMDTYDVKIDSIPWGITPMTALENDNLFHKWIEANIIVKIDFIPDISIQVTVPNEFQKIGKFNIGVTAGIETTLAPKDWVDGCNRMDLIITTSNFSKEVLIQTIYNENHNVTGQLLNQYRITTPIDVLFEGVNTKIYNNQYDGFKLNIEEDFAFLVVGHWLPGDLGQDRKDIGMTIKCFIESFKETNKKPALVLKTSMGTYSIKEREMLRKRIEEVCLGIKDAPSIYLLFGELTDKEMNGLYNHPKIKTMVTLTKGEGFGRPLLEFSMTGKPIMASNWSGHKDFLPMDKAIMLGGSLTDVHESAINTFILKDSKWFTANYNEVVAVFKLVVENYEKFFEKSDLLRIENSEKFTLKKMEEEFKNILSKCVFGPQETKLVLPGLLLPKLTKIK